MLVILVLRRWREEDQEFMIILGYIIRSRPSWATRGPVSPSYASSPQKYRKGRKEGKGKVRKEGRAKERSRSNKP